MIMQIGFVGTGSMGSILIEAFLSADALLPDQIVAFNRTPSKAEQLAVRHPGLQIAMDNAEVAERSQIVILCVKPFEYRQALEQFAAKLTEQHILVTITSPVQLKELEQLVPCPVVRVIPSITNAAKSGVTVCEFGSRVTDEIRETIFSLFAKISQPIEVSPAFLRIAADISSCGPAFLSYILQQMIASAAEQTGISREAATYVTTQMVIGFAELLKQEIFSLPALQERVCVPGGITGEGLIPLQQAIPGLFDEVFKRTHAKFAEDVHEVSKHLLL
jgi:competence protein ComER